jgi:hypothetical protein
LLFLFIIGDISKKHVLADNEGFEYLDINDLFRRIDLGNILCYGIKTLNMQGKPGKTET